ncbi:unnamed protein product [Trichobilharzia regenti]|nr:unnamed protein product [Trichobilharzia regenti]
MEFLQLNKKIDMGISFIDSCVQSNGCVYIHCKAGRTRSAYLLTCYLMSKDSMNVDKAIEYIQSFRKHVMFRPPHKIGLQDYYELLNARRQSATLVR